jgi:hypothetical protein
VYPGRFKPFALIEAMSVRALLTRIQMELTSTSCTAQFGKPRKKGGSVPA